jgi:hypothetical protein
MYILGVISFQERTKYEKNLREVRIHNIGQNPKEEIISLDIDRLIVEKISYSELKG